jgi:hypothetical protein
MTAYDRPDDTTALAARQLDAYNNHDLEAFCACFAEDVEAFALPSMEPLFTGRAELRARYGPYFEEKRPQARLVRPRLSLGTIAIDAEAVTMTDGKAVEAIALYHVDAGLIRRFWLIKP